MDELVLDESSSWINTREAIEDGLNCQRMRFADSEGFQSGKMVNNDGVPLKISECYFRD